MMEKNRAGKMIQKGDHTETMAQIKAFRNNMEKRIPLVVILGRHPLLFFLMSLFLC